MSNRFEKRFIETSIGGWYYYLLKKVSDTDEDNGVIIKKGIDECDLLFAMLNKIISDFKTNGDTRKNMLQRTLERVYGSYGNMGNIQSYKLPYVYNVYLYISMFIFVMLFPLNYEIKGGKLKTVNITADGDFEALYTDEYSSVVDHEWNIIWHGLILVYFLFGFHSMTTKVGNAFKSRKDSPGYATVGQSETETNSALLALYKAKREFQGTYETLLTTRNKDTGIFTTERMNWIPPKKNTLDMKGKGKKGSINKGNSTKNPSKDGGLQSIYDRYGEPESKKDRSIYGGVDGTFGGSGEGKDESVSLLTNRRKLYV